MKMRRQTRSNSMATGGSSGGVGSVSGGYAIGGKQATQDRNNLRNTIGHLNANANENKRKIADADDSTMSLLVPGITVELQQQQQKQRYRRRSSMNSDSSVEPMDISSSNRTASSEANSSLLALKTSADQLDSDTIESENEGRCAGAEEDADAGDAETEENEDDNDDRDDRDDEGNDGDKDDGGDAHEDLGYCRPEGNDRQRLAGKRYRDSGNAIVRRENLRETIRKKLRMSSNVRNNNNLQYCYDKVTTGGTIGTATADNANENEIMVVDRRSGGGGGVVDSDVQYPCPICGVVSLTQHDFTEHIRYHHNTENSDSQTYACRICAKVLSSASSLDRHVLVHTGERPFTCKYCHVTFTTNGNMHRHMRTHKHPATSVGGTCAGGIGEVIGGGIGLVSSGGGGNANTFNNNTGNDCYESDASADSSASNTSSYGGKRKCSDDDLTGMRRKMRTINNNNNNNNNIVGGKIQSAIATAAITATAAVATVGALPQQKFCCPVCVRNDFNNMMTLENHMDREHPTISAQCRHCEHLFKSHKALNAHRCGIGKPPPITHGFKDLTFVDFSSEKFPLIAKSVCEQSIRTPITSQKYECTKCYRAFPCSSAVDIHERECGRDGVAAAVHDFSLQRRKRSSSETSDEEIRRDDFFANLDLQNKSTSTTDTTINTTDSPGRSPISPPPLSSSLSPSYKQQQFLQHQHQHQHEHDHDRSNHRHHDHESSRDLADIQSILSVASSSGNFLRHLDRSWPQTPSSQKGVDYLSSPPLTREEEEAQDVFTAEFRRMKLRGEFPCKLCSAVFPNLRALKGHNRIHLSGAGAGPYRCNMCPYAILDKTALIRHMRTHNGDRPYECAICNYAFTTKANCERHLRNRHAKTTRDEVKRAIIYHPSEDSSCEDPVKKLAFFGTSSEFDGHTDEDETPTSVSGPKDRSTPVSHLREMLMPAERITPKIQVKSLEKLIGCEMDDNRNDHDICNGENDESSACEEMRRRSSMDALDLSKKSALSPITLHVEQNVDDGNSDVMDNMPKIDFAMFEKNQQQLLLAQQQFFSDTLPKLDPSHYFQLSQLYRNFMFPPHGFPPLQHFLLQNSLLPPPPPPPPLIGGAASDVDIDASLLRSPQMSGGSLIMNPLFAGGVQAASMPVSVAHQASPVPALKAEVIPESSAAATQPSLPQVQPIPPQSPGPIKMVIKNGVLMPKQKQRRYRTERPFACEHCSARFTLRSNMERHIKQQHPQYWAQRQRSGHHIMRRGGAGGGSSSGGGGNGGSGSTSRAQNNNNNNNNNSNNSNNNNFTVNPPLSPSRIAASAFPVISDQVKYAILAQQLKCRPETMPPKYPIDVNSSPSPPQPPLMHVNRASSTPKQGYRDDVIPLLGPPPPPPHADDDEPPDLVIDEDPQPEDLSRCPSLPPDIAHKTAKKVAENILEQAMKASSAGSAAAAPTKSDVMMTGVAGAVEIKTEPTPHSVSASRYMREEADLVPVSKLVDNATNTMSFGNYFRNDTNTNDHSDEEGLIASGSASESNNSGTDDYSFPSSQQHHQKKKSAYSLAPNRVSCPYCQRMFPWSSSLRRHVLTHTGQKPFKCSHCPLLFTTKSNCDRHLLRKHGNVESAVSLYVPIDECVGPEPQPIVLAESQLLSVAAKSPASPAQAPSPPTELLPPPTTQPSPSPSPPLVSVSPPPLTLNLTKPVLSSLSSPPFSPSKSPAPTSGPASSPVPACASVLTPASTPAVSVPCVIGVAASAVASTSILCDTATLLVSSELPFKCHLCDASFGDRITCLGHIKMMHVQEFELLMAKGAIETEPDHNQVIDGPDDDERCPSGGNGVGGGAGGTGGEVRGKYPDYANRKVICAFCVRRFWSTEDLRRHMRTHSGERPFQCDVCLRKFTLKHSMLRHQKKHSAYHHHHHHHYNNHNHHSKSKTTNSGGGNQIPSGGGGDGQTHALINQNNHYHHHHASHRHGQHNQHQTTTSSANSASDISEDEQQLQQQQQQGKKQLSTNVVAMAAVAQAAAKYLRSPLTLGSIKRERMEGEDNSDLIGNLLGISDAGILNRVLLSSADEAAKLLGVEK